MRVEVPTFTRCCGCLPLRRGIIILGYLSLALALLFIWVQLDFNESWTDHTMAVYRGAGFYAQKWIPVLLYFIEIAFIIMLLVGAHMERPRLMRVYYYYGITTTAAALPVGILSLSTRHMIFENDYYDFLNYVIDFATILLGIATEVYLLLLIRSQLQKPQNSLRVVNHLAEVCVQPPVQSNDLSFL